MKNYVLTAITALMMVTAQAQWIPQNAGFTNDTLGFYEMSIPNRHTAWAVCFDPVGLNAGRFILDFTRTTDGGATWIPGKMGNDHSLQFSNISAINGREAWVAMNKRYFTGGGLYHTTDGGLHWAKSNPTRIFDENSYPNFVYFKNKNKGIAMGDPNNGYFEVYTTTNGGRRWNRVCETRLPANLPNEFGFISGYAVIENTVWFGTSAGRIYKSTNFGRDWTVHTVDVAGKFVNEIAFNDDKLRGVAHLRDNTGQTFLYSTANGGTTWTNLGQPANWKSSRITAVPGTDALISTAINTPLLRGSAISYDNGSSWTEIENAVSKTVSRFYDCQTGYACGTFVTGPPLRGGIFKSEIVFQHSRVQPAAPIAGKATPKSKLPISGNDHILQGMDVSVYPLPANQILNITLPDGFANKRCVINLSGMDGKIVYTGSSTGMRLVQVKVSALLSGQYLLRIEGNGKTISKMITIAR